MNLIEFCTAVARLGFKRRAIAVLKSNLIRSTAFGSTTSETSLVFSSKCFSV